MVDDNYTLRLVFDQALRERPQRSDPIGVDGDVLKPSEAVSATVFSTLSFESPYSLQVTATLASPRWRDCHSSFGTLRSKCCGVALPK